MKTIGALWIQKIEQQPISHNADILFSDYLFMWLDTKKGKVRDITYVGYESQIVTVMSPYFAERGIYLGEMTEGEIGDFYVYLKSVRKLSNNTINRYHAIIHATLKLAVRQRLISTNFSEYVDRESVELPTVNYYTSTQLNQLFRILNGSYFEIFVIFGALYGLRRSEILGLKWSAVDFDNSIIYIRHTVVKVRHKGNGWNLEKKDICKSKK